MIYVRVPQSMDNKVLYPRSRRRTQLTLIGGELFTVREYTSLVSIYDNMPRLTAYLIELPKSKTYTMFGCRFPDHDTTITLYASAPVNDTTAEDLVYMQTSTQRKMKRYKTHDRKENK